MARETEVLVRHQRNAHTRERGLYLSTAILTVLVVTAMLRLWRATWTIPFYYSGDAVPSAAHVKSTLQWGWYEDQPNLGAPYGQHYHDFPFSDNFSLVIVKGLGVFADNWPVVFNLYYLLGFLFSALAALWFLRKVGVSPLLAIVLSVLFAVAPYHFFRNENHYFLSAYFTVPLILGVVYDVMRGEPIWAKRANVPLAQGLLTGKGVGTLVVLVLTGSTVAYYAVFGGALLAAAALAALARTHSWRRFGGACLAGVLLVATLVGNLLPDVLYQREHPGAAALYRPQGDSEVWALKLASLIMPPPGHRLAPFAQVRDWYDANYPLGSEQPALGLICALALIWVVGFSLLRIAQRTPRQAQPDPRWNVLAILSFLVVVAFLFATVGGLGTFVSFATDAIRGWNRMSIFMSALLLGVVGLGVQMGIDRSLDARRGREAATWRSFVVPVVAGVLLVVGIADQSVRTSVPDYAASERAWRTDEQFVRTIETTLPPDAMVFQLPYLAFPEGGKLHDAGDQDMTKLSLHSTSLRWSGGGLKGRPETDWPGPMSQLAIKDSAPALAKMGFSGIVVDHAATDDNAASLTKALTPVTGPAVFSSTDGRWSFFSLLAIKANVDARTTPAEREQFTQEVLTGKHL